MVIMVPPLVMTVTSTLYPAGLVCHREANTLISIGQHRNNNYRIEAEANKKTTGA
jgi:hypothetical protein